MEWMSNEGYSKEDIEAVKRTRKIGMPGTTARMLSRGATASEGEFEQFKAAVKEIIRNGKKRQKQTVQKVSVQDNINNQVNHALTKIELVIDQLFLDGKPPADFNMTEILKEIGAKATHTKRIAESIQKSRDELDGAIKDDEQLAEAYLSILDRKTIKAILKQLDSMLGVLEYWETTHKTTRRKRKTKAKPAEKIVQKVTYKEKDDKYNISSIAAENVVGCQMVVVLNTRNAYTSIYHANNPSGFTFKGTTIKGWDKQKSYMTKIKKLEANLPVIMTGKKQELETLLKSKTNKHLEATGRINNHCMFIRIF